MFFRSASLTFAFKKLGADKRKLWGRRAVRDQTGESRGVLIKQITDGLMEIISRGRWSYSHPAHQITVKSSHVNGGKVSNLNINYSRRGAGNMKEDTKTEMV